MSRDRGQYAELVRLDAGGWRGIGSPFYGELGVRMADDIDAGGPVWDLLAPTASEPYGGAYALRLLGGVHRMVLAGHAPALARHYGSMGGDNDAAAAWPGFLALVATRPPEVVDALTRPPQTNEIGRSAALTPGLLTVAASTGLPLRLLEIGSSAGLNLRVDGYWYEQGGVGWGDPDSPVRFVDLWPDAVPPLDVSARVASRRGCDRDPIDATDPAGRERLLSYLWPDQPERLARTRAALDVASRIPAPIEAASADEWLPAQLAEPVPGVTTVVYHSVFWQYLPDGVQASILATLADAGARATTDAPLAHLRLEPHVETFFPAELRLTSWPGPGEDELLANAGFHYSPVEWLV